MHLDCSNFKVWLIRSTPHAHLLIFGQVRPILFMKAEQLATQLHKESERKESVVQQEIDGLPEITEPVPSSAW